MSRNKNYNNLEAFNEGEVGEIFNLLLEENINKEEVHHPSPPMCTNPPKQMISYSEADELVHDAFKAEFSELPKYNEMSDRVYIGNKIFQDEDESLIRRRVYNSVDSKNSNLMKGQRAFPNISEGRVYDIIVATAMQNSYNPFKDYVESKAWNQIDHISALFDSLVFQTDYQKYTPHYKEIFKKFFISIVAKAYVPGAKNFVLVLQGDQGIGKSRWCDALLKQVPEAFAEGAIDPEKPEYLAHHAYKILWHIAEFDAVTGRKDVAALKAYVDYNEVTFRRPYDKRTRTLKSTLSFIASVNSVDFLKDPTGSRRYVVMPLSSLKPNHGVDMQQVYAQAKFLLDAGSKSYLSSSEEKIQAEINNSFSGDSYADVIHEYVSKPSTSSIGDWLTAAQIQDKIASDFFNNSIKKASLTDIRNRLDRLGLQKRTDPKKGCKYLVNLNYSLDTAGIFENESVINTSDSVVPDIISIKYPESSKPKPSFRRPSLTKTSDQGDD